MIYLVTASLNSLEKVSFCDFSARHRLDHFLAELRRGKWARCFNETWLIDTDETADQISQRLRPYLEKIGDFLLVVKLPENNADYSGNMPVEMWDWINETRIGATK